MLDIRDKECVKRVWMCQFWMTLIIVMLMPHRTEAEINNIEQRFADLSADLSSDEFSVRKAASEKLSEWAKNHRSEFLGVLPKALGAVDDPEVVQRLRVLGEELFVPKKKAYFGFNFSVGQPLIHQGQMVVGIEVNSVISNGPADRGGLSKGDIILGVDGESLTGDVELDDVIEFFSQKIPDKKIKFHVLRQKNPLKLNVRAQGKELTQVEIGRERERYSLWLKEQMKK